MKFSYWLEAYAKYLKRIILSWRSSAKAHLENSTKLKNPHLKVLILTSMFAFGYGQLGHMMKGYPFMTKKVERKKFKGKGKKTSMAWWGDSDSNYSEVREMKLATFAS